MIEERRTRTEIAHSSSSSTYSPEMMKSSLPIVSENCKTAPPPAVPDLAMVAPPPPPLTERKSSSFLKPAGQRRGSQKSVAFSPTVRKKKTLHVNDYTPEERKAAFYDDKDIVEFHDDAAKIQVAWPDLSKVNLKNGVVNAAFDLSVESAWFLLTLLVWLFLSGFRKLPLGKLLLKR